MQTSVEKWGVLVVVPMLFMLVSGNVIVLSAETTEIELERRFNELYREHLEYRSDGIDRWIEIIVMILALGGVISVVLGFFGFRKFTRLLASLQKTKDEIDEIMEKVRENEKKSGELVEDIQTDKETIESIRQQVRAREFDVSDEIFEKNLRNLDRNPDSSFVDKAITKAYKFQRSGRIENSIRKWEAIAHIVEGVDDDLAARARFSIGYLYLKEKKWEKAISAYNDGILLKKNDLYAYINRGVAKNEVGKFEEAIADFNTAIELNSGEADAYNNRGVARLRLGKFEEAIADFNTAIELNSDEADAYNNNIAEAKQQMQEHYNME